MLEVGNTPMVKLDKYSTDKVRIFAKVEGCNPGGSIKDRVGFWLVESYLVEHVLTKDDMIIEATSGNTGIGLAMACNKYNIYCVLFVPKTTTIEKIRVMIAYNAKVVILDGTIDDCIDTVKKLSELYKNMIWLNQYDNRANIDCHYETTSKEIYKYIKTQINEYSNTKNIFIAAMGTTGTIMGCSKRLRKEKWEIIGVMPTDDTKIEGLKNLNIQRVPKIFNRDMIDNIIQVTDKDASDTMKQLVKDEGIFAGLSSGAALFVAKQLTKEYENKDYRVNIVVILPDTGRNYLNSGIWDK